ncbi:MAG: hydrogenase formation protein HypD [Gemmatimonadetes bacterium]|nr:hydrogenase formation protein HypD [Gemmatimonadota bacterium]MBT7858939.1 hydrogenase formation protein HypD [Gemmatimonadota bacterium]
MKFVDEFRSASASREYAEALERITTRPWTLMEVCGGQTHAIVRFGIDRLLPEGVELIHGPGCPVCVTPMEIIDEALELAARPEVILCSFGDMLRVPGSSEDLFRVKSRGGDVRIVYSPLDALDIARKEPDREVVFFAVGFETTAPANAMAVAQAHAAGIENFSLLVSHVLVPPAMEALLSSASCRVQGFLAAGHVCMVMGTQEYEPLAKKYGVPIVITGFEPLDILQGVTMCIRQLEEGRAEVENQYARIVRPGGNEAALEIVREIFTVVPRRWRGLGEIERSGLGLAPAYEAFDAERRFDLHRSEVTTDGDCRSGEVLQGLLAPTDCPAFRTLCTPENPLGATMVSSEGACAAYYRYRRQSAETTS